MIVEILEIIYLYTQKRGEILVFDFSRDIRKEEIDMEVLEKSYKSLVIIPLNKMHQFWSILPIIVNGIKRGAKLYMLFLPAKRGFSRFPYLFFLLFLKKKLLKQGLGNFQFYSVYPSINMPKILTPLDRDIYYFIETEFYHRLKNPFMFFLKKTLLKVLNYLVCTNPVILDCEKA